MPTNQQMLKKRPIPLYLILSEKWYTDSRVFSKKFRKKLFGEKLGYEKVIKFENKYLWPKRTLFAIAGWPRNKHQIISPDIVVFKKKETDSK